MRHCRTIRTASLHSPVHPLPESRGEALKIDVT
jgi:hypothetical protein